MINQTLPLLLQDCPAETLPTVVDEARSQLTRFERMRLGHDLAKSVGLRAEALLSGMDLHQLDDLLDPDDVDALAALVEPHL